MYLIPKLFQLPASQTRKSINQCCVFSSFYVTLKEKLINIRFLQKDSFQRFLF
jgi:hypothetical protein